MELSFRCRAIEQKECYEQYFKYWYNNYIEYSCCYRRIVSMLNTALFNRPIAISKVAVGLLSLRGYSITKKSVKATTPITESIVKKKSNLSISSYNIFAKNYMYNTSYYRYDILSRYNIELYKNIDDIELSVLNIVNRIKSIYLYGFKGIDINSPIYLSNRYSFIVNKLDYYILSNIRYLNKSNTIFLYNYNTSLNLYGYKALREDNILDRYSSNSLINYNNSFSLYEDILLRNYNNSLNRYYTNALISNKVMDIYNNYLLSSDIKDMNIYKTNVLKSSINSFSIYKDYLLSNLTIANILFNITAIKYSNFLRIYKDILSSPNANIFNIYDNILSKLNRDIIDIYSDILLMDNGNVFSIYNNITTPKHTTIFNILKDYSIMTFINQGTLYSYNALSKNIGICNINDRLLLNKSYITTITNKNILLELKYKVGLLDKLIFSFKTLSDSYKSNIVKGTISDKRLSIGQLVLGKMIDKRGTIMSLKAIFKANKQIANNIRLNDVLVLKVINNLYQHNQYSSILNTKGLYLDNANIGIYKDIAILIEHKDSNVYKSTSNLSLLTIESIYKEVQAINLLNDINAIRDARDIVTISMLSAYKSKVDIKVYESYNALRDNIYIKRQMIDSAYKNTNDFRILNDISCYKDKKSIIIIKGYNALRQRDIFSLLPIQQTYKDSKTLVILKDISSKKSSHYLSNKDITTIYDLIDITNKPLSSANIVTNKDVLIGDKNKYLSELDIRINISSSSVYKNRLDIEFIDYSKSNYSNSVFKDSKSFIIKDTYNYINKINKSFIIYIDTLIDKTSKSFTIQYQDLVNKIKHNLEFYKNQYSVYKDKYNLELYKPYKPNSVNKISKLFDILYQDYCSKYDKYIDIYNTIEKAIKIAIPVDINSAESVLKNNIGADHSRMIYQDSNGLIVPVAKTRHYGYIARIDNMCIKNNKKVQVDYLLASSVMTRSLIGTTIPDLDIMIDKSSFKSYIDYTNKWAIKKYVKTKVQGNDILNKYYNQVYIPSSLYSYKNEKEIYKDDILSIITQQYNRELNLNKDVIAIKDSKDIYLLKQHNAYKSNMDISILNQYFIRRTDNIVYYYYNVLGSNIVRDMNIDEQVSSYRDNKEVIILDYFNSALRDTYSIFYEYDLFPKRLLNSMDLVITLDYIHKIQKDLDLLTNDKKNFVWVYETPDPFPYSKYGIDELLLPEQDTRYEDFENIIFNKETLKPRNPVKQIDETTFIAKYPIKHPLPERKDIGIVYIDVETSVMRKIFLMYYRIWQSKIFQFGSMTMVQSTKMMLEYIYTWIIGYFPLEQMEEALRVFRLIRWYSETAIIQNSQYIISYDYDVLESKLNTGKCNIPNNLSLNDTMIIDSKLGVIKNNPAYIGKKDATVTFYIDNKKNTRFIFSLSNTIGSVNVYINDELVDTISKSVLNKGYDLLYTGDINEVRIEKTYKNNLNSIFYIGNIKIPNCSYKDLTIEYNPILKAGNKPINEVASKIIEYANLYDNKEEIYNIIRKGNLGVSETNKRLEEYWKIHHADKVKGKRLTIKEV